MIWITSDSALDMPVEWREKNHFAIEPTHVILGGKEYRDGVDITNDDIYEYVARTGKTPKTAATPPDIYREFFQQFTDKGDEVIHISLSSGISAMSGNAKKAAEGLPGVYVIDGRSLSSGTLLLVLYARDLRDSGMSAPEIVKAVKARRGDVQCSFVVDNLEFLHKGGRCSGVSRFASTLLKIKPTIIMAHKMVVGKKYIGTSFKNAVSKYVEDVFDANPDPDLTRIFITYTTADPDIVEMVREQINARFQFKEIFETQAQSTITSHCGKNTLGILYLNNPKK